MKHPALLRLDVQAGRTISIQGGTLRRNITYQGGPRASVGDYKYFPKFSGADIRQTAKDEEFIQTVESLF